MAVFGPSPSFGQQQQQPQARGDPFASFGNGGSNVGGARMARRTNPGAAPPSSGSSVPLLRPPAGDTPSYSRMAYSSSNGGYSAALQQQQPQAMVPFMGEGRVSEGTPGFGPGAIVPHTSERGMTPTAVSN